MRVRATAESRRRSSAPSPSCAREVADLALAAAGRVVGETMTDERQRRLVEEFLRRAPAPAPTDRNGLMARRDTRRATLRRGGLPARSVTARSSVAARARRRPAEVAGDERRWPSSPTRPLPLDQRTEVARRACSAAGQRARSATSSSCSSGAAGSSSCRGVAAEFRRLDDARQGITHATATSATPLTDDEVQALTARARSR